MHPRKLLGRNYAVNQIDPIAFDILIVISLTVNLKLIFL